MSFRVLGPLEVDGPEGGPLDVSGGKPATVLTLLLLHRNAWVSTDQLVDAVWAGREVPASAQNNLKTYIWQLRRALPQERIESRPGAYRVRVESGELDADLAANLSDQSRKLLTAGRAAEAVGVAEQALGLWRGCPYDGLTGDATSAVDRLTELHRALREDLADAQLALGRSADAIALLRELIDEDPLRELAWTRLMTAYRRTGRRHDALAAYQRARTILVRELGIEPGAELTALHQQLLCEDNPTHPSTSHPTPAYSAPYPTPNSHPRPGSHSTLALPGQPSIPNSHATPATPGQPSTPNSHATPATPATPGTPDSHAVPGSPGPAGSRAVPGSPVSLPLEVGRRPAAGSTLPARIAGFVGREEELVAVQAAHTSDAVTVVTIDGMAGIGKTAFGLEVARLFDGLEGYFSLDLEKGNDWFGHEPSGRVLLILDNVTAPDQARQLLPATTGSVVLVISRHRLTGLDRHAGITLEPLPADDAARLTSDERILRRTAGHPAAIRLLTDRIQGREPWTVDRQLNRLDRVDGRLTALADVYRRFDSSYRRLGEPLQRLYRLLGATRRFDARTIARLAGLDLDEADVRLDEPIDHHLVTEPKPGRFTLHPLVRDHAYAKLLAAGIPDGLAAASGRRGELELVAPTGPRVA